MGRGPNSNDLSVHFFLRSSRNIVDLLREREVWYGMVWYGTVFIHASYEVHFTIKKQVQIYHDRQEKTS